ncbi:MAG: tyrosine-protein kinase [Ignavibacteriaceae bacterium]
MTENREQHNHNPKIRKTREKSLLEIIQIILKRKNILIVSVLSTLALAMIYNYVATPTYESSVLLKKEKLPGEKFQNEFAGILNVQTDDVIETEMELVTTWNVLKNVVNELNLFLSVGKIITPQGNEYPVELSMVDYNNPEYFFSDAHPVPLPEFKNVSFKDFNQSGKYYLQKTDSKTYTLYDEESNKRLMTVVDTSEAIFETDFVNFTVNWPDAKAGSVVYFSFDNYYKTLEDLKSKISVDHKAKTDVFEISVRSTSPYSAALIANTLTDKFRESRIDQQKQTIRYSFNFVDKQLQEMQDKLKQAENDLSGFKASGQIMTIDQSSRELIDFLSNLEAEKMKTELQLTEYKNKALEMQNELQSKGFFDQSFLSPEGNEPTNSPFATLMKQLSDLELKRLELLQKRTASHPDVIALDEQIKLVEQKLASFNQNTITSYQIIVNALEKKLLQITNLMSKYEVKMERLPAQENRLAELLRQKNVYEKIFTVLLDKREEMRMAELSKLQDIVIVDPAHEPIKPITPKKSLNLVLAFLFGMFAGFMSIFVIEFKNNKLINLDDLEEQFNVPILAIIPSYNTEVKSKIANATEGKNRLVTLMEHTDGYRETFRLLKTKVLFQMEDKDKVFMVTSCEENTGKTTIVANLAVSIAQEGKKVLIIDCDLRKAQLSSMFDIPPKSQGLKEFLTMDVAPKIYNRVLKRIDILPAGGTTEDSGNLLNSDRMKMLFDTIGSSSYDYIIIDTPPVTRVVDTLVLGRLIKDALLVVRPGYSLKESVEGGFAEMLQAKIKVRGIVANAAEIEESSYRYKYGYGYGYGKTKTETVEKNSVVEV